MIQPAARIFVGKSQSANFSYIKQMLGVQVQVFATYMVPMIKKWKGQKIPANLMYQDQKFVVIYQL